MHTSLGDNGRQRAANCRALNLDEQQLSAASDFCQVNISAASAILNTSLSKPARLFKYLTMMA